MLYSATCFMNVPGNHTFTKVTTDTVAKKRNTNLNALLREIFFFFLLKVH